MRVRIRQGTWLAVWLVLATAVPAGTVLWFMKEASRLDANVTRRALADAYRGHLRLIADRLDTHWRQTAAALAVHSSRNPPQNFESLVLEVGADSYVILGPGDDALYPSHLGGRATGQHASAALSARARQQQAALRKMNADGQRVQALTLIARHFDRGPLADAVDEDGRVIAADAQLLRLTLMPHGTPAWNAHADRLVRRLQDYGRPMPAAQRLFLMSEVEVLIDRSGVFPTKPAERLAMQFLETNRPARSEFVGLRTTTIRDLWQLPAVDGRVVALFSTDTIRRRMQSQVPNETAEGPSAVVLSPGQRHHSEGVPIGQTAPGWLVSFDAPVGASLPPQQTARSVYMASGLVAVCAVVALMAGTAGLMRRQMRVASMKSGMVSAVSHELRTPLASMRLLVDNLLDDAVLDAGKTRDYLRLMAAENSRLTRVVDNFLTYARLERGPLSRGMVPLAPRDVVDAAVEAFSRIRGDRPAPRIDAPFCLPEVLGDPDALVTALLNLLDNAYKYTASMPDVRITICASLTQVNVSVEDNGLGVPASEQTRIFGEFYRVDQTLTSASQGVGLGLHIVRRIVRAHGGSVGVAAREGGGSIFTLVLPALARGDSR